MCVYVSLCIYMYVRICICVYVYVYICICVYMHACIFVSSSSSTAMGSALCPMPVSSTSSNFLCPTPSVHICVCMHNTCICLGGKCPMGKCPTENGRRNCPGVICPGVNCPEGNCRRGLLSYTPIVDCQTSDLCELQQNPHACMDDRSSLDLEAEHGVTMDDMLASPWMTCRPIVEVRLQNTC